MERQWTRILSGKVSILDFIFAKEVRLGTYSARASTLPPAAIVATKAMLSDPRAEPRYAERVPYVVIHGEPGARLADMVIDPYGLLEVGSPYRLNEQYYITKQIIPALQRVFGLLGADLNKWFNEMPRPIRSTLAKRQFAAAHGSFSRDGSFIRLGLNNKTSAKGGRIDTYYMSSHCSICGDIIQGTETFCNNCLKNEAVVATIVAGRTSKLEREIQHLAAVSFSLAWVTYFIFTDLLHLIQKLGNLEAEPKCLASVDLCLHSFACIYISSKIVSSDEMLMEYHLHSVTAAHASL